MLADGRPKNMCEKVEIIWKWENNILEQKGVGQNIKYIEKDQESWDEIKKKIPNTPGQIFSLVVLSTYYHYFFFLEDE